MPRRSVSTNFPPFGDRAKLCHRRVALGNGVTGIGEAATLGGPRWSEESVESIKATIDTYLAAALIGSVGNRFVAARARMDEAAKRNNAAKSVIETALFDTVG